MTAKQPAPRPSWVPRFIGFWGCAMSLLCIPPVAEFWLVLEPLHAEDRLPLWLSSGTGCVLFAILAIARFSGRNALAALAFPLLVLLAVEMGNRVVARNWPDEEALAISLAIAHRTYPDLCAFEPHAFLNYTGRPGATLLEGHDPFNQAGFIGPNWAYEKPPNTVRIACLGGSTTVDGYPMRMQKFLAKRAPPGVRFEVMNFGMNHYSTAHMLVNLVLNVLDYEPDYVVAHEAWNDVPARNHVGPVRGDYRHTYKPFDLTPSGDAWLIRASMLYRSLKYSLYKVGVRPAWTSLAHSILVYAPLRRGKLYDDPTELWPYARNMRSIADFAAARGATPVLTTQPHSTAPRVPSGYAKRHIDQCNELVRGIAEERRDSALFVDLDALITGKHNEFFVDVAHMKDKGRWFKARAIGQVILTHYTRSQPGRSGRSGR